MKCQLLNFNLRMISSVILLAIVHSGCAALTLDEDSEENNVQSHAVSFRRFRPADEENRQVQERPFRTEDGIKQALADGELILGMKKNDVLSVWGHPREIEVAGETQSGNERWVYLNSLSYQWGLKSARVVYFESGRVVGWENAR